MAKLALHVDWHASIPEIEEEGEVSNQILFLLKVISLSIKSCDHTQAHSTALQFSRPLSEESFQISSWFSEQVQSFTYDTGHNG